MFAFVVWLIIVACIGPALFAFLNRSHPNATARNLALTVPATLFAATVVWFVLVAAMDMGH